MQETIRKVETYLVNTLCDCKKGYMMYTGKAKPAIEKGKFNFTHRCSNCKKIADLKKQYPIVNYKEIKNATTNKD